MRDPLTWSMPLARLFGITVRVHVLFPLVAVALILRVAFLKDGPSNLWIEAAIVMGLLFVAVLLHELGHCAGARLVDGDVQEVLLWPLGGLAAVDVPHTPRAHLITVAAGPFVNLLLCLGAGGALALMAVRPPLDPWWAPYRYQAAQLDPDGRAVPPGKRLEPELFRWDHNNLNPKELEARPWIVQVARFFWVNWILFLLNVVLIGFPLDGGRLFQCLLWPRLGFREATRLAIGAGFIIALVVAVYAIVREETLSLLLALFIYVTCRQQFILLETGAEESLFGYDFSQGYTSLERDQPRPRRRPSFVKRWLQNRAAARLQREQEIREKEERRMDELLEKVQREGLPALSDEERRFLTRVSARYRNRQ
jgi:stage IV sporulation protein FB